MRYGQPDSRAKLGAAFLGVAAVALAGALRYGAGIWLDTESPYLFFRLAVVASAWRGGLFGGATATLLGAFAGRVFFEAEALSLALFFVEGAAITALATTLIRQKRQSEDARRALATLQTRIRASESEAGHAAELLRMTEERVLCMMNSGLVGFAIVDAAGRMSDCNAAFASLLGVARDELLHAGRSLAALTTTPGVVGRALVVTGGAEGQCEPFETRIKLAAGDAADVIMSLSRLSSKSGEIAVFVLDNTKRAAAEADYRRKVLELESLLAVVPIGILVAEDRECRQIYANDAAAAMLKIPGGHNASLSGAGAARLPFRVWKDGRELKPEELPMQRAAAHGVEIRDTEFDIVYDDGSTRRLLEYARPIHDEQGAVRGSIGVFIDITDRRNAEIELLKAKERAEAAHLTKVAFIANMSHEIRTPLSAILGFCDFLLDPEQSYQERRTYVSTIQRNGAILAQLVEDILDVSKIEADRLEIELLPTPLAAVISDLEQVMSFKARDKGVDFKLACEGAVPAQVLTDPTRLRQVLFNVVGNAIKFTERGSVTVTARHYTLDDGAARLELTVQDTGVGMAQSHVEKLFQPFSQGDASTTRRFGGTGLGLYLSRKLARMLGGDIELVQSTPGRGSIFRVVVAAEAVVEQPDACDTASEAPDVRSMPLDAARILLVEDSPDMQFLTKRVLELQGAKVDIASNGLEGFERATSEAYDVVLMDIQMPEMDGFEATAALRGQGYAKPIVALTANAMKADRERILGAGFDHYLPKPIDFDQLIDTVGRYAPR